MAKVKDIVKDLEKGFGTSDDDKARTLQLFKGLVFSDDDLAKKYMKALDTATTKISKEVLGGKKEENWDKIPTKKHTGDKLVADILYQSGNLTQYVIKNYSGNKMGFLVAEYDFEDAIKALDKTRTKYSYDKKGSDFVFYRESINKDSTSIQLAPGQKVLDEAGNEYELEEGDSLITEKNYGYNSITFLKNQEKVNIHLLSGGYAESFPYSIEELSFKQFINGPIAIYTTDYDEDNTNIEIEFKSKNKVEQLLKQFINDYRNDFILEESLKEAKTQRILDLEQDILSMEQEVKDMEDAGADAEDIKAGKEELADMKQELTDEKERETE